MKKNPKFSGDWAVQTPHTIGRETAPPHAHRLDTKFDTFSVSPSILSASQLVPPNPRYAPVGTNPENTKK